jgi:lipid A disaccharide synthetase
VSVFLGGIYIAYKDINIIAGEKFFNELAEGATTPETLRQKDCNNINNNLESSAQFVEIYRIIFFYDKHSPKGKA